MRYIVTGAAGFIGSHLSEALLAEGHEVRAIDSFSDFYDPTLKEANTAAFPVERLDVADEPLDARGFDGIFHLAGQGGARGFGDSLSAYLRLNVLAAHRVFEAAASAGVRVVFASSSSVYGDAEAYPTPESTVTAPLSPYGVSKLAAEHIGHAYARAFGLDLVVLRYFSVFGPRQRPDMAFARVALALTLHRVFDLYGSGRQTRGWTYVSDVVAATVAAMAGGSGIYNVGGAVEVSLREVIEHFERLAGRPLQVRERPAAVGEQPRSNADTSRIRAELGWSPQVELADGIEAQWGWASELAGRGA
ncbi:MAG: UDP-glucuronate 4-epimerase [Gaiellaceae bacterium]|jgi:UDP-glucuronate 4-epimerase|nr:UDP-glucuronate 4-epimerase [Gaiellaceae bacterium]